MGAKVVLFVLGLIVGIGATALYFGGGEDPDSPGRVERGSEILELRASLQKSKERCAALEEAVMQAGETIARKDAEIRRLSEARPPEEANTEIEQPDGSAPGEDEINRVLAEVGSALQRTYLAGDATAMDEPRRRLQELFERGGEQLVARLLDQLNDASTGLQARSLAVHGLAQSGNSRAIEALKNILRDPDAGMLEHRLVSQALSVSEAEGLDVFLAQAVRTVADEGTRANLAFGLARRGSEEGITLYFEAADAALERNDPVAIGYLQGFALLGEKALPAMRERLLTYQEPQALILLIELVKRAKDKGAIENLEKLAYDSSRSVDIQKAAEGALKAVRDAPK